MGVAEKGDRGNCYECNFVFSFCCCRKQTNPVALSSSGVQQTRMNSKMAIQQFTQPNKILGQSIKMKQSEERLF